MFKLFNKYKRLEKTERKILNRTFFWLIYAFILVRFIPLRWFSSILGEFNKEIEVELSKVDIKIIKVQQKNIRRLKRFLPWQIKCFEEAITAKKVLETYNIKSTLFLGVAKESGKGLKAHAWLKFGDNFVAGEKGHKQYVVTGFYS